MHPFSIFEFFLSRAESSYSHENRDHPLAKTPHFLCLRSVARTTNTHEIVQEGEKTRNAKAHRSKTQKKVPADVSLVTQRPETKSVR